MGVDKVFKALADPTRRGILRLLGGGELSAGEISERFPVHKSTLSGHLNVLKEAGLVSAERRGKAIFYSLEVAAHEEAVAAVMELLGVGTEERDLRRWAREGGER